MKQSYAAMTDAELAEVLSRLERELGKAERERDRRTAAYLRTVSGDELAAVVQTTKAGDWFNRLAVGEAERREREREREG